jgi:hypothetical protein
MAILEVYSPKEFFSECDFKDFRPGQFCWTVTPYINPIPLILYATRNDPKDLDRISFEIRNANREGDFKTRDRVLPVKRLNLESHEELLVQRAKKRPGIILCSQVDIFPEIQLILKQRGKKHLQDDVVFVVPCYGLVSEFNRAGFIPEMVFRIRHLLYRQFFYFPGNKRFDEGVARFDRSQIVIGRDPAAIEPTDVCLADPLLSLFLSMFLSCISGVQDPDLAGIRELTVEAFKQKMEKSYRAPHK